MASDTQDLTEAEPFKVLKSAEETGGEFVRFAGTHYPAPDSAGTGEDFQALLLIGVDVLVCVVVCPPVKRQILAGTYRVVIEGTERTLSEGEEIVIPPNTPHRHFNPTASPIRTLKEDRPARQSEEFFTALYALAQKGQVDEQGLPGFLQFAVLQDAYPGHAYMTDLPVGMQKTMFSVLGPVGRLLGYRADVTFEDARAGGP